MYYTSRNVYIQIALNVSKMIIFLRLRCLYNSFFDFSWFIWNRMEYAYLYLYNIMLNWMRVLSSRSYLQFDTTREFREFQFYDILPIKEYHESWFIGIIIEI